MTEDDDYMNDYDRPPRARTIEDVIRPHERVQFRNSWHTEPTRWEKAKQGLIQAAIIIGALALVALALAFAWSP